MGLNRIFGTSKEIICDNLDSPLFMTAVCSTYIFVAPEGFWSFLRFFSTFGVTSYIDRFRDLLSLEKKEKSDVLVKIYTKIDWQKQSTYRENSKKKPI